MRRDPTEFRERFLRWKNGELVYKYGLPHYLDGKDALGEFHDVSKGDTLWAISRKYNVPLLKLRSYNPNIKGDLIHVGDLLRIKPSYDTQYIDILEERAKEDIINTDSFSAIQAAPHDSNYVVVDKKNKRLDIFDKDNNLIYSTNNISTGASGNDYNTITYVDNKGQIRNAAGNNSTPAGISVITGQGKYHGFPSFTRGRIGSDGSVEDIASSFHYGKTDKRNSSNGCVRIKGETLKDMTNFIGEGTMVYTLPEQGGSRFSIKNGKLNFTADNPYGNSEGDTKYWDDYNVNIDKSYSPIHIYYNGDNTDSTYNGNVLGYVNSVSANKQALQKRFNLSSDEYNRLAELAVGIAQQESKYGTSRRYKAKIKMPDWLVSTMKGGGNPARSRGMTQIKIGGDNAEMREIYRQLGVSEDTIDRPEISAIATMARLAYMYNTEVKGRDFRGENNVSVNPYDALLYKYIGLNKELKNKTATPDKNKYIRNVKNYSKLFGFIEPRRIPHYEYGRDAVVDDIINNYEGFLTTPTDIGDGKITIGSGLTNQKWIDKYNKTGRWTKADNYAAVKEEVDSVRKWMPTVVPQYDNLPKGALDVLVDIGYNIGRGGISKSKSPKFHAALERGDWEEAARLMDWGNNQRTSDGRPMGGLLKRNATRQQRFLAAMDAKSNPLDRVNVEQLLEYTTSSWLNRPSYMKNDLEKPMNTPDPIGEFFVKARAGVKAAGTIGNYLRKRQIQQQADIYRKTRQYQSDTENYTGRSLRRENIKEADAYARDSRYRGMYSDNPFIFLYDLFVDPVVQYYTKLQSHPIWGPILP